MESDQWKKIEELFHDALELDPARRGTFLDNACAGDKDLRQKLETLLSADSEAEGVLDKSAIETVAKTLGAERHRWATDKAFGHYRILSMIGAGGMGEVYLADDTRLPRRVALKLLPEAFTRNRERVERFRHEARATSALNHPNIITIYEVGHEEGVDFIASEFVEGETLRKIIETRLASVSDVLDFTIQVASALQAAHRAGVVHRDIKPENVMIRHDGIVKVLDFGLAKLITQHPPGKSTRIDTELLFDPPFATEPGQLIGTVRYMSPEQIREREIDGRSDLFSLGVVLYEVLTGRAPFKGESAGEVMSAILVDRPLPLELAAGAATADLERIVNRALAKEPENRYQSATEILVDLNGLKDELGFEARLRRAGPSRLSTVSYASPGLSVLPGKAASLEPVGGAVPLDSEFYIVRSIDSEFEAAIARRDSIVLVKGPRQVGKTSLLARGLQRARESGARVVLTDFQGLSDDCFETAEKLLQRLGGAIAEQIDLDKLPEEVWSPHMGPSSNFERFLRREVLTVIDAPIVWGLDEVDRLFTCEFGSSIFGLFRSWHNKRALDPQGPWMQLTLAIAYATEAHLFITDLNQSPFNVGTQLLLEDFTIDQVADLNSRYGSPLKSEAELALYYRLVGGHPYLVRRGLHEMTVRRLRLDSLVSEAGHDHGPFGHHLRRILVSLTQDRKLCEAVKGVLQGRPSLSTDSFFRLQSAGVIAGDSAKHATPRCQLYKEYLKEHLQ